ncbi:MAG TPA: L-seryl-tRNA(Sec) selenium transferase [Abditibacteriaceae bacterium]
MPDSVSASPASTTLLRALPRVDDLVQKLTIHFGDAQATMRRPEILQAARQSLDEHRQAILQGQTFDTASLNAAVLGQAITLLEQTTQTAPRRVLNGTGIVIHTGLGRSLLSRSAVEAVAGVAASHCALEVDIESGERGKRDASIAALLREITGAEDATVCNNCAGATFLALNTLAQGKTVACSRGELVEIGGGFRMPDVMVQSGCTLREVGTTNKTRLSDYESVFDSETEIGALLKVHTSNFRIVGFTAEVPLAELTKLGHERGVPVIEDLGSGVLVDLTKAGLPHEPRVQNSVIAGADVICFSGDKLLGGPQCGVLVGKREAIARIRKNPMMRALRCDKFTLAALEATLRHYRDEDEAWREIPTLRALGEPLSEVKKRAQKLARMLQKLPAQIEVRSSRAQAGAGALPTTTIDSFAVCLAPPQLSLAELARRLRINNPSIWGRIHENQFWLDCRTLSDDELKECALAIESSLQNSLHG